MFMSLLASAFYAILRTRGVKSKIVQIGAVVNTFFYYSHIVYRLEKNSCFLTFQIWSKKVTVAVRS